MLADLFGLSGQGQLIVGAIVLGAIAIFSSPTLKAKLLGMLSSVKSLGGKSSTPSTSVSSDNDVLTQSEALMDYFVAKKDEKGVALSGAVAQYVLSKKIDDATNAVHTPSPAPVPSTTS